MEKNTAQMWKGLVFLFMAIALAMVLICPALLFRMPPFYLLFFLFLCPSLRQVPGYLSVVRSVCKIE